MTIRSSRRRLGLGLAAVVTLGLVLAGCGGAGPDNGQNSLKPNGAVADKIDNLILPIFAVACVIGAFVLAATVYVAIRYRARPGNENPKQIHGSTPVEIAWTLVPAVILAVIAVPTVATIFDIAEKPDAPLEVTAIGKQWWWQFEYPAAGGKGVVTADELHIPTGRSVWVSLKACDASLPGKCNVIHSFWVPELAGKKDVIPGRTNELKIQTDRPGTYLGQCAEYCGLSHANMRFRVIAQPPGEFRTWLAGQRRRAAVPLNDGNQPAGEAQALFSQKYQCTNCHAAEDSSVSSYGPNLTHLASRSTFASGYYELTKPKLVEWILNAPSLIPMESQDCRKGLGSPGVKCVGMPSFTQNTPPGQPVMTQAEAEQIADYLLQLK